MSLIININNDKEIIVTRVKGNTVSGNLVNKLNGFVFFFGSSFYILGFVISPKMILFCRNGK